MLHSYSIVHHLITFGHGGKRDATHRPSPRSSYLKYGRRCIASAANTSTLLPWPWKGTLFAWLICASEWPRPARNFRKAVSRFSITVATSCWARRSLLLTRREASASRRNWLSQLRSSLQGWKGYGGSRARAARCCLRYRMSWMRRPRQPSLCTARDRQETRKLWFRLRRMKRACLMCSVTWRAMSRAQ